MNPPPAESDPPPSDGADNGDPNPDFTVAPARYCLSCGRDLTDPDDWLPPAAPAKGEPATPRCPACLRHFDPDDDATFRDTPKPEHTPTWRDAERWAPAALFVLYLFGILVLAALSADYQSGNNNVIGALALALSVPWLIACVYLALLSFGDRLNPTLPIVLPLATALGVVFALGSPPIVVGAAFLLGPFTGLLFNWRNET